MQGGITCGAIDEPRKSSKAIDERVIINFRVKNVVIVRFCHFLLSIAFLFYRQLFCSIDSYSILSIAILIYCQPFSVLSIAFLFYRQLFFSIDSFSVLWIAFLFYRQLFCSFDSFSVLSIALLFYRQLFCSIHSFSVLSIALLFYRQLFCSIKSFSTQKLFCYIAFLFYKYGKYTGCFFYW